MSEASKAVFLSYASQDAEAAKRIADALRAAGVEVWFDTDGGLEHGDEWDAKIRRQIKECVLFIAIISANTQAREEGYFRIEWELAAQRALGIASGVAFILPVVIDDTKEPGALVPDRFRTVQWTRLPGGNVPADVLQRFLKLWSHRAGVVKQQSREQGAGSAEPETAPPRSTTPGPKWVKPILASAVIVIGVLAYTLVARRGAEAPVPSAKPATAAVTSPSEAQQLVAKAGTELAKVDLTRAELEVAGEFCKQAAALAPTDAEVWAAWSQVDSWNIYNGFDDSRARRESARSKSERAMQLAPQAFEARLARACYLIRGRSTKGLTEPAPEAEPILRGLLRERPGEPRALFALGILQRDTKRPAEMRATFDELARNPAYAAIAWNEIGWAATLTGDMAAAEAAADKSIAVQPYTANLCLKIQLVLYLRGDLEAAAAAVAQLPDSALQEDFGVALAMWTYLYRREWDKAVQPLSRFSREWLDSPAGSGPRGAYLAWIHQLAGRDALAEIEWRAALKVVDQRLAETPNNGEALSWKGTILASLGDRVGGEKFLRLGRELRGLTDSASEGFSHLLLGEGEEAVAAYARALASGQREWNLTAASFRLNPEYDPLRKLPGFPALVAQAEARERGANPPAPAAPRLEDKSVAVLAFADLSAAHDSEYFSDGISEELLNVLAKVPGLKVSARTSAFYFKGKNVPIPEIAQKLGVAYVVEGSVRRQGDKVRITAQLIKADGGFHVWSDTFTRDLKDIFAVQDEIAGLIAKNLELKMGIGETVARQAVSPEAYQEYLLGRASAAKAGMADLREAVGHFERAVALEPKYTAAWVQLAGTHTQLGRWGGAPTRQSWAAARAAIDRARALEPDSPEVLLALGWILRTSDWDWKGAERAFRRALALQPNQPEILAGAAVLLYNIGQKEEAFRLAARAIQLDPLNAASQIDLSIMYYENDNWADAEQAARRALQLAPGGTSYHSILSWNLIRQGRYAEAEVEIAQDTDRVEQSAAYGLLAIARGEGAKTREMVGRLQEVARTQGDIADVQQCIAWLYTGLGEKDHAFAALEKARVTRDPSISWLRNTSELKALGSDPRWNALLRQVGLADEQLR